MFKLKARLKSSTLVETLVGSVILLISYSFLLVIFLNFFKSNNTDNIFNANITIDNIFRDVDYLKTIDNNKLKISNLVFDVHVSKSNNIRDCYYAKINVFNGEGKFLFSRQRIINIFDTVKNK